MRTELSVPAPEPPDGREAWYAPAVHDQREIVPGVVATVRADGDAFAYDVREPSLSAGAGADLRAVEAHFSEAELRRPRTREGTAERFETGLPPKYRRVIDRLVDCSPGERRRLRYHALAELACLGELTPYALDDAIEVADVGGETLRVHLTDYAPAKTDVEDTTFLGRFSAERIERYTVQFAGYSVPVVRYRERLLGADPFERKYAVLEPNLLPGDRRLIEECKERIWGTGAGDLDWEETGRIEAVRERGRNLLSRRLTARSTRAWLGSVRERLRMWTAELGLGAPPVERRFGDERIDDLLYYVLRDLVGYGQLTVPVVDPHLEDVEANRVGERIKVVPRGGDREPTNLRFESEAAFVDVVTKLAADDGVELSASRPAAEVDLTPPGVDQTIRCAVALPSISAEGPYVSIRKQAPEALTPVDLIENGSVPPELVALLWLLYEHRGTVLFAGERGVGKTTLLNAHTPFIAYEARPVSIDEGSREIRLPHETGVSLTADTRRDGGASMADLVAATERLNPDVEVLGEIGDAGSFNRFGDVLGTGRGVLGTVNVGSIGTFLNRALDEGVPAYALPAIDLVVRLERVGGDRRVAAVYEVLTEGAAERLDTETGLVERDGETIHYNRVLQRDADGDWAFAHRHPKLGDPAASTPMLVFDRIAASTGRSAADVETEFHRKREYVEYLVREGVSGVEELFGFLSDLRTDEAATIARIRRERADE